MKFAMLGITENHVANFDETDVYFLPEFWTTIVGSRSQNVTICKPYSSNRATAILSSTMEGKNFHHGQTREMQLLSINCKNPSSIAIYWILSMLFSQKHGWMNQPCLSRFMLFGNNMLIHSLIS